MALELKSVGLQEITYLGSVIDLTVVNQDIASGFVNHWLVAQGRQVLDG
jgi:hypothetical protein